MKNITGLVAMLSGYLLLSFPIIVLAQFKDATVPSYGYGMAPLLTQNTGNDIQDVGGTTYEVMVCDDPNGNNALLGWKVGGSTGFTFIGQGAQILDPDVCLVKNGSGLVYALVVYYDPGSGEFMWQTFNWVAGQQSFNALTPVSLAAGQYNKTINIDSEDNGNFAIVWDEPGANIRMAFGQSPVAQLPQLSLGGAVLNLEPGSEPDVCYYRNTSTSFRQIDVVYRNPAGYIIVDFYKLNDLLAGSITPTQAYRSPAPDLSYRNPRIACPISATGESDDFTVVVEDTDGSSTWYIKSFNANKCCSPTFVTTIYNDGSTGYSPYNLTQVPNTRPVVAYDNIDNTVWVTWNLDNMWGLLSAPGAYIGKYPVAIAGDKRSEVIMGSNFLIVPEGLVNNASMTHVSIAGTKSSKIMFSYIDNTLFEAFSKSIPHLASINGLKTSLQHNSFIAWLNAQELNQEKNKGPYDIKIHDLAGRLLTTFNGNAGEITRKINQFIQETSVGMFMISARSSMNHSSYSGKLFTLK